MARSLPQDSKHEAPRPALSAVAVPKRAPIKSKLRSPDGPQAWPHPKGAPSEQSGRPPVWRKATPVLLKPEASVDEAMAVILSDCTAHWRDNLAAAIDGRQPEGTHQVRVGLRRFRSALSIFKKYIPTAQRAAMNAEAKWLLTQLGPARDLDVFIGNLAAPLASRLSEDAHLAQLIRAARCAQTEARATAVKALRGPRAARFSTRLETWISGHGWRAETPEKVHDPRKDRVGDFARRFVNRRMRNIRGDYDDVEALTTEQRHELRIAVKKVRYGLEFFQAVLPAKRMRQLASTLKHMQDNLGHLNDIDVAERTVSALVNAGATGTERRQIAAGGGIVSAWHKDAAAAAEPEMLKLWRKMKKVPAF